LSGNLPAHASGFPQAGNGQIGKAVAAERENAGSLAGLPRYWLLAAHFKTRAAAADRKNEKPGTKPGDRKYRAFGKRMRRDNRIRRLRRSNM